MISIPRFEEGTVDRLLTRRGMGAAFQDFISELLVADYPDLRVYPVLGRDGGADLVAPDGTSRVIVECKHISNGTAADAEREWRETHATLARNVSSPSGPSQSQYGIWYSGREPISKYLFCTSAAAANEAGFENLRARICSDLAALARRDGRLGHLASLQVEVLSWNGIEPRLKQDPVLPSVGFHN